ncbi:MAG: Gfo/Idh/MocA family oxidoreductase [Myxococcales bacterium]|nr:Gfo/Idh/MocA family oxidoreductase [Myxococcales bacterium]
MNTPTPRVGVVGLGRFGAAIAERLAREGALAAVCDLDPARRARFGDVPAFADLLDLLAADAVQAVVLATPAATHAAMARAVLDADRDLWVEPPLALDAADAEALARRAAARRRVLMVDGGEGPALAALLRARDEGTLGALHLVEARRADFGPFHPDEPVHTALLPDLYALVRLMGEPPTRLRAVGASVVQAEAPDHVTVHLHFGGGARAVLTASRVAPTPERRLTALGADGMAVLEGDALTLFHHRVTWQDGLPRAEAGEAQPVATVDGLAAAVERFLAAVDAGETALPDAQEAATTLRLFAAIGRSLDADRGVSTQAPAEPAEPAEPPAAAPPAEPDAVFVHPTAVVDGPVELGPGTRVWHFSKLLGPLRIGARCSLGQNVVVERHVTIGDNVKIQNNVSVYSGVVLEDDVFCGPSMVFTNVGTPRSHYPRKGEYAITRVERGASIGANATVVCGHTLGRYCFVGAGAVVTKDVPPYALVFGNPARVRGWTCYCGLRLDLGVDAEGEEQATCGGCDRRYTRRGHAVRPADEGAA